MRAAAGQRRSGEDAGQAGVARRTGVEGFVAEGLGACWVHRLCAEPDQTAQRTQGEPLGRTLGLAVDPERVQVTVVVPAGSVGAGVAGQRCALERQAPVQAELESEVDPQDPSAICEEGKVEGAPVPGGHHARLETVQASIERPEDVDLITDVQLVERGAGERNGPHGRHGRIEAVLGGVGLDVESVDRCMLTHRFPHMAAC